MLSANKISKERIEDEQWTRRCNALADANNEDDRTETERSFDNVSKIEMSAKDNKNKYNEYDR